MVQNAIAHPSIEADYYPRKPLTSSYLVRQICHIYHQLDHLDILEPCDHVNTLFTKLVHLCTSSYDDDIITQVLSDAQVQSILPNVRLLASKGEYLLELYWARSLISRPDLSRFVYFQNYVDLVRLELHGLEGVGALLSNIVFIGSGPLPLSSILMYQVLATRDQPFTIHNIDRDQASIDVSSELLNALGIAHGFQQHVMDASCYSGFEQADVVVLGALVGNEKKEKIKFMQHIGKNMKKGAFIMARSAHSLRKLLYPSIEPHHVNMCGFETAIVLHPFNDVVNSVLIARKV